jgi:hypothetical protein
VATNNNQNKTWETKPMGYLIQNISWGVLDTKHLCGGCFNYLKTLSQWNNAINPFFYIVTGTLGQCNDLGL